MKDVASYGVASLLIVYLANADHVSASIVHCVTQARASHLHHGPLNVGSVPFLSAGISYALCLRVHFITQVRQG